MTSAKRLKPLSGGFTYTLLVEEDGIYLCDMGYYRLEDRKYYHTPAAIIKKFKKCFSDVWARLPDRDRDTLTELWGTRERQEANKGSRVDIEFEPWLLPHKGRAAECDRGGLKFYPQYVEWSKPRAVQNTIAHELGHAISHCHGWFEQHECKAINGECVACECRAYSYMAAWGFDPFEDVVPKRRGATLQDRLSRGEQMSREALLKRWRTGIGS